MARPSLLPRPMLPRSRSANSACSLPSSAVMLTALAASLSSCSDDTLASISETVFAPSRLFNSASAACSRLLCRSYNALSMHATDASRLPVALVVDYAPRRSLDGVPTGPLLVSAWISLRVCLFCSWPKRSFSNAFISHMMRFLKTWPSAPT